MTKTFTCEICGKEVPRKTHNQMVCSDCRPLLERARAFFHRRREDITDMSCKEMIDTYQAERKQRRRRSKITTSRMKANYNGRRCRICGRKLRTNYFYCRRCHRELIEYNSQRVDGDWVYV